MHIELLKLDVLPQLCFVNVSSEFQIDSKTDNHEGANEFWPILQYHDWLVYQHFKEKVLHLHFQVKAIISLSRQYFGPT